MARSNHALHQIAALEFVDNDARPQNKPRSPLGAETESDGRRQNEPT
jgi:hypothetical protein